MHSQGAHRGQQTANFKGATMHSQGAHRGQQTANERAAYTQAKSRSTHREQIVLEVSGNELNIMCVKSQ